MNAHREITVTGTGEGAAPPDMVTVDLGVSVIDDTVAAASKNAAKAAQALITALVDQGVNRSDIATVDYSISPEYDWSDNQRRLIGFRVNNTVRAVIRELAESGKVLDHAVATGGDAAYVHNIRFSIADETTLEASAREAAWSDALAKAEHLARLSGQTLGGALSIVETVPSHVGPLPVARLRMETADVSTPLEGGSTTVTVALEVRFQLTA